MSRLSSREKKLVLLIFGLLFAFGNVAAFRWWREELGDLEKEQHGLELALLEAEALYAERTQWEERQAWLDATIATFPGREAADAELLKLIETSARQDEVVIESSELLEPPGENVERFARAGVRVKAAGTLNQLVKWIHGFQEPKNFRALTNFEFANDGKNPGMVRCQFHCWEWRREPSREAASKMAISDRQ